MEETIIKKFWFALYIRHRHEAKVKIMLDAIGVENYLPMITRVKKWSDRKKRVTEPLLRGYIFIKASEKERLASLELNGVFRCVSERGEAAKIPEFQIDNMKQFVKQDIDYSVIEGIVPGNKVRIKAGPFEGVEGIIVDNGANKELAVSIDLLNRTVITKIEDSSMVEVLHERET